MVGNSDGSAKVFKRAVTGVDFAQTPQVEFQMSPEKRAMDVEVVGYFFIGLVDHEIIRRVVEQREHAVGVATNHLSVAPRDRRREERGYLDVFETRETSGELHRVGVYELRGVDARSLGVAVAYVTMLLY